MNITRLVEAINETLNDNQNVEQLDLLRGCLSALYNATVNTYIVEKCEREKGMEDVDAEAFRATAAAQITCARQCAELFDNRV